MADTKTTDTSTLKTKEQWDDFIKTDLLNFLILHNAQKITIDDGAGKKGVIKIGSQGEYKIQITSNETM